jgi:biopolymer transport protein ExbD
MNLRPRRRPAVDINMAPLIDVVFLLLIFFMVSTTFRDESRLRVQLPEARGDSLPAETPAMLRIVIDQSGRFAVNDQVLADAQPLTLARALTAALGARTASAAPSVLIQADARTAHQAVMTAMDVASQAGLHRIIFAATQPEGATP